MTDEMWNAISEAMQAFEGGTPLKDYYDPDKLAGLLFDYAKGLRAIVDKLPKTADGVPVAVGPDVIVWELDVGQIRQVWVEQLVYVDTPGAISKWWVGDRSGHRLQAPLSRCYSTREAAEGATSEAPEAAELE